MSGVVPFHGLFATPTRNGVYVPKEQRGDGYKMLNMGELFAYPRVPDLEMERVRLSPLEAAKSLLEPGDLLFARRSLVLSGAGKCAIYVGSSGTTTFESSIIRVRLDPMVASPEYYFYFFNSPQGRHAIESIAEQVAVAGIRGSDLSELDVPLPPLAEQRAIAGILGALDDKIALNRQMNATLEGIARALFQSWFVDFDPVRAKAECRAPGGMDAEIAALFPDSFEDSALGPVPRGWRVGTLGGEFNLTMGQSPPGETYNEDGVGLPFYQGRRDFGTRYPSPRVYCDAPTRLAEAGDTLVSVRAPVGDLNMAIERCAIGRGVAALRHISGGRSYTYYSACLLRGSLESYNGEGTVFGSISGADFKRLAVFVPPVVIVEAFEREASAMDNLIEVNEREISTLAELRDALLPKLVSGALRVGGLYGG